MRKILRILSILFIIILTGCQGQITLDNAQTAETEYQYAKVTKFGSLKELPADNFVISQAKDYTNKLISVQMNRSYKKLNISDESILYSENYKNKVSQTLQSDASFMNEFYQKYLIITELLGITYNKVIIVGDDAFLNITVKNTLTSCISNEIAKQIGYTSGINDIAVSEFNIKLIYIDNEYLLYDYERVNKEGYQKDFKDYAQGITVPKDVILPEVSTEVPQATEQPKEQPKVTQPSQEEKDKNEVKDFINRLASLQNNRNYETLKGNEDYVLLSDEYIAKLNKKQDDVAVTKKVYQQLQLVTELLGVNIKSIQKQGESYVVDVEISSKIIHCVSEDKAKQIGYSGGIGSVGVMEYSYTVKKINSTWKLTDSKQIK